MRLSELKTGEKGVIVKVLGHGGFRKRIVEMGFITNEGDRTLFQDEAWQEKMAAGAFNGIKSYCETYIG